LNEKCGSSTWKQAVFFALQQVEGFPQKDMKFILGRMPHMLMKTSDLPPGYPTLLEALSQPDVPRFMFVRSPYARILSAYQEKILLREMQVFAPPGYVMGSGFAPFIEDLYTRVQPGGEHWGNGNAWHHYDKLSQHCYLPDGLTYDFHLKVEQMDMWYEPFVDLLGIKDVVQDQAWNTSTQWHVNKHNLDCFYVKAGCSNCSGMFTDACGPSRGADVGQLPATFHALESMHGARFRQKVTLEDAIGSLTCSLEASMRVTNGIPLECPLLLPVAL
jgi:hypothetical protein